MTEKHEAMVESFLASAVEELEGGVVPAEMGILSMMVDGEAGTRDLTCFTTSPVVASRLRHGRPHHWCHR